MFAQLADLAKVPQGWDNDTRLSLNWLDKDRGDVLAMQLERSPEVFNLTISDGTDCVAVTVIRTHALEVWSESIPTLRVCAHAA
jgi:urease accessory protein UreE